LSDEKDIETMPAVEIGPEPEARREPPELPDELIDELLAGARTPEQVTGPDGLLQQLTKRLVERAMDAELTDHLGYERGAAPPGGAATPATARRRRRFIPSTARSGSSSRAIGRGRSSPGSCPSTSAASPASTTRSLPSTPAA
jgi:hypothetical protein